MKLLFDQNISFRIVRMNSQEFPEAKQVKDVDLENTTIIKDFLSESSFSEIACIELDG